MPELNYEHQQMQANYTTTLGQQAAKRPTEITSEFNALDKNLEELLNQVSLLEDRLSPILSPMPVSEPTSVTQAPESGVPLAREICQLKRRVAGIGSRVASILDRIEL